jgi:cytochrome c peroxidase
MGLTLPDAVTKLRATTYYAALFQAAFGSPDITSDRVAQALAQFVRAMVSTNTKYDRAFTGGPPNFTAVFTANELAGQQLFNGIAGCARCHQTAAFASDNAHNTGLDATVTDVGAGAGRFKAPSLRNVALRGRYMHDGRFTSLEQVVEFYNSGVQNNPNLDPRLRAPNGQPVRLNLSATQKTQLVAFMRALTDSTLATAPKFSSPFGR